MFVILSTSPSPMHWKIENIQFRYLKSQDSEIRGGGGGPFLGILFLGLGIRVDIRNLRFEEGAPSRTFKFWSLGFQVWQN